MALDKSSKEKEATKPEKPIHQTHEQVYEQDANPGKDNLANKGEKVVSGRGLPDTKDDSAPTARK